MSSKYIENKPNMFRKQTDKIRFSYFNSQSKSTTLKKKLKLTKTYTYTYVDSHTDNPRKHTHYQAGTGITHTKKLNF